MFILLKLSFELLTEIHEIFSRFLSNVFPTLQVIFLLFVKFAVEEEFRFSSENKFF